MNSASVLGAARWPAEEFFDIYFERFHQFWPILHRKTFFIPKEPCILLQSMIMIGLWIKGDEAAKDKAMIFHRKLLSEIQDQKVRTNPLNIKRILVNIHYE